MEQMRFVGKRTYLWGASLYLKEVIEKGQLNLDGVLGVIDADPAKKGRTFCGLNIYNKEDIAVLKPDVIIISAPNHPELEQYIASLLVSKEINAQIIFLDSVLSSDCPCANSLNLSRLKFFFKTPIEKLKYIHQLSSRHGFYHSKIPGMITTEEKRLLHMLAKYYYTGEGAIFDAGIFLGGCCETFINGLSENPFQKNKKKQIWAYELGDANNGDFYETFIKERNLPYKLINNNYLNISFSYLEELQKHQYYTLYPGDIMTQPYPDKIEMMFIDVCKSSEVNFRMQQLFGRLIPGKSIVIQQDYIFDATPELRVTMGYLKDYFEFVSSSKRNIAVFLLKKKIPLELLRVNPYEQFTLKETIDLHNYYNRYLNAEQIAIITKAIPLIEKDFKERSHACLKHS